jgi:hypothetical protein
MACMGNIRCNNNVCNDPMHGSQITLLNVLGMLLTIIKLFVNDLLLCRINKHRFIHNIRML